ncbi:ATP-binding cassette domain-containing protein, partial [Hydrogenophaga aromaticivorans]|uniref:ATP-binding cassette domain-containing protein n=1 Tax=Hydrogenophaga aromaticivorans TaxID=2610898 RepID=UPI001B36621B|nr:ATP-binding cassette domain-containing protein [Hydrogenophaga aromaticivorans]
MIHTRDLACRFADGRALRFADVDVPQGGTLLLRGPSGSGKSTWLALAAGLLSATGGEMAVAGQSVGALAPAARDAWRARTIGFLPQRLLLSEALTVAGNLGLVFFAAGLPLDKVAMHHTLDALGVAQLAACKPARLSGGE